MKTITKTLAIAALVSGVTSVAAADTLAFGFRGMNQSSVTFTNKDNGQSITCDMTGSGAGAAPNGCNWEVGFTIENPAGQHTTNLREGTNVCTITCY